MSAPNGGIPSEEEKNFFNSVQIPFPEVIDGKIDTLQFLESSKGVASLIGEWQIIISIVGVVLRQANMYTHTKFLCHLYSSWYVEIVKS